MIIKRRRRTTEEDRAKELAKAREKRQKKMIRTKYGQAPRASCKTRNQVLYVFCVGCICVTSHGISFFCCQREGRHTGWICRPFCACYGRTWAWRQGYAGSKREIRIT